MKKNVFTALLVAGVLCLGGCGNAADTSASTEQKKDVTVSETTGTSQNVPTETSQEVSSENAAEEVNSVYPGETELVDLDMGAAETAVCTIKVPLNYVLAGGYYDADGNEQTIEGVNSATTTVKDAMDAGIFSSGKILGFFTETSLDGDQTMITAGMYDPNVMSWDDFKEYYSDAKEIGDESVPGIYYYVQAISGQTPAVAIKVSDDLTLQIVYEGPLKDKLGADVLAQELYNLVTVK